MTVNRAMGLALLGTGFALLAIGFSQPATSGGRFPWVVDQSTWMLLAGGFATALGLFFILSRSR